MFTMLATAHYDSKEYTELTAIHRVSIESINRPV